MTDEAPLLFHRSGPVATIVVNRPAARNAMTLAMYDTLAEYCDRIDAAAGPDGAGGEPVRVAVLRGAGGKAFVAGTDIAEFLAFAGPDDGVAYERRIAATLDRLERVTVPTVAVVQGFAVGGGLAIAATCDLRVATPESRFGVPIARTLGNCLATGTLRRLVALVGQARTRRLILTAALLPADEAHAAGLVDELVPAEGLDARVRELCEQLAGHAPLTLRATKEQLRRLGSGVAPDEGGDDLVAMCYGSADFAEGVRAFLDKRPPRWTGR